MQKMENQQALLLTFQTNSEIIKTAINRIEDYRTKVSSLEGEVIPDIAAGLRGWEGAA